MIVYHVCDSVYIALTIDYVSGADTAVLLVIRLTCICAASSLRSIGGEQLRGFHVEAEHGKSMALFGMKPLLVRCMLLLKVGLF